MIPPEVRKIVKSQQNTIQVKMNHRGGRQPWTTERYVLMEMDTKKILLLRTPILFSQP
jgi:hypothetical protein